MNKKNLPHIITAVSFLIFIVLVQACASVPRKWEGVNYNGEDSKLLEGTEWRLFLSGNDSYYYKFELQPDGKVVAREWNNGSWERNGEDVKLVLNNGRYYIEGKFDPDNIIINGTIFYSGGQRDITFKFTNLSNANGFDTALYGRWTVIGADSVVMGTTNNGKVSDIVYDVVVGYTFYFGNFITFKRWGKGGNIEQLEKGTYTTDDKGTLTFKVTHYYDRSEKIFLSKDEFTTRQKTQGKTTAQINDTIKEYFPDRSVKYSIDATAYGSFVNDLGYTKVLTIKESINRLESFLQK